MKTKIFNTLKNLFYEAVDFNKRDPRKEYPKTVAECLDDNIKYRTGVYKAMKDFKDSHPWKGSQSEMQQKIVMLNQSLARIYEIDEPKIVFVERFPLGACCFPNSKPAVIMMEPEKDGRYSIICYLHEFGHCLNKDEKQTCRWSINLFRKFFPKSYNALEHDGHLLRKKQ